MTEREAGNSFPASSPAFPYYKVNVTQNEEINFHTGRHAFFVQQKLSRLEA